MVCGAFNRGFLSKTVKNVEMTGIVQSYFYGNKILFYLQTCKTISSGVSSLIRHSFHLFFHDSLSYFHECSNNSNRKALGTREGKLFKAGNLVFLSNLEDNSHCHREGMWLSISTAVFLSKCLNLSVCYGKLVMSTWPRTSILFLGRSDISPACYFRVSGFVVYL